MNNTKPLHVGNEVVIIKGRDEGKTGIVTEIREGWIDINVGGVEEMYQPDEIAINGTTASSDDSTDAPPAKTEDALPGTGVDDTTSDDFESITAYMEHVAAVQQAAIDDQEKRDKEAQVRRRMVNSRELAECLKKYHGIHVSPNKDGRIVIDDIEIAGTAGSVYWYLRPVWDEAGDYQQTISWTADASWRVLNVNKLHEGIQRVKAGVQRNQERAAQTDDPEPEPEPEPAQPASPPTWEFKRLVHEISGYDGAENDELAEYVNDGWEIVQIDTNTVLMEHLDTHKAVHFQIITLKRAVAVDTSPDEDEAEVPVDDDEPIIAQAEPVTGDAFIFPDAVITTTNGLPEIDLDAITLSEAGRARRAGQITFAEYRGVSDRCAMEAAHETFNRLMNQPNPFTRQLELTDSQDVTK